jgi:hypothetical protein
MTMKNLILAAIATLSLGLGIANAQTLTRPAAPDQTGVQHFNPGNFVIGSDGA